MLSERKMDKRISILTNEKIRLRPIERKDIEYLNKWKNDEEVYKFLGGGFLPVSADIQEKWLDSLMDTTGNNKRFIIENIEDGPVGLIGLYSINWIHRTCELGIFIGEKNMQGKGYASNAYMLLENYAKKYLNLRKIKANVVRSNEAAVEMYKKLNFTQVGCLKEERFINGKYHDLFIMEKIMGGGVDRHLTFYFPVLLLKQNRSV